MTIRLRAGAAAAALLSAAACAPAAPPPTSPAPVGAPAAAAAPVAGAGFDLSVPSIMRGERLVGRSPDELRFSEDGRWLYFRWREPTRADTLTSTYRVAVGGGEPERLEDTTAARLAPVEAGSWSRDRRRRAFIRAGDVFVVEVGGRERRVTDTPVRERAPQLSADGRTVYFLSGGNLHALELGGGPLRQLTDLRLEDAPKPPTAEGQRKFLEAQQQALFGVVRDRRREEERRERLDSLQTRVRAVYLGKGRTLLGAEVSPSGRVALLSVGEPAAEKQTLVPNFVTESGYTEPLNVRAKVGDAQAGQRAALLELATGKLTWIEPAEKERRLTLISQGWAPASERALLIGIAADYKDRWLYVVDAAGRATTVDHLRDDAWVGGPGLFTAGWLPAGAAGAAERVYFVSERSGYAHLYTVAPEGGRATALTSGAWEVTEVQLAPDERTFYLTTSEAHPGERHLYALPVSGGTRTPLAEPPLPWNEALVSPDGRTAAILASAANQPPELFLAPLAPEGEARQVTRSTTEEFRRGPWVVPELLTLAARDGARVHARLYRPEQLGAEPSGAAVVFVHGAGYLQNAHRGWSTYFREYMFHHLLASKGYTVLDLDYRGSAGYGRDWRVGIYRHMGGKDLTDHVDGARWLVASQGIDAQRIGIYGGSYGGFITLMAMFTTPEVFRAGAALRSVTDWAHYNHWYTSRILNQPQDDSLAYRRSSPIYFAEGLQGDLLIAHGMVDTNVHFQDVVRLAQRLIELGKTHWELAVYPVEDHAFTRPDSWTDEYRRILELFERTLR